MSSITPEIVFGIFIVMVFMIFVFPPLIAAAVNAAPAVIDAGKTIAKTTPEVAKQLCIADEKITEIRNNLDDQILEAIPATTEEEQIAKWNLLKIYNGVSLTIEELQTLKNIPKYYKYHLEIDEIEKDLVNNPEMLCELLNPKN